MDKEKLLKMGLSEEQAEGVMKELDGNFVTKARFNEVNAELKQSREDLTERNSQLDALKQSAANSETLQKQLDEIKTDNENIRAEYETRLSEAKFSSMLETGLISNRAKDTKAVKALMELDKISLDGDKLAGFDEQIETLKKEKAYLFEDGKPAYEPLGGSSSTEIADLRSAVEQRFKKQN